MLVLDVRSDLLAEQMALDAIVAELEPADWNRPTASPGWTVADQIGHLAYFDRAASVSIEDSERFASMVEQLWNAVLADPEGGADEVTLAEYRTLDSDELLALWRADREALAEASSGLAEDDRLDWYGPPMGAKSFLTARLMECWAHGHDIAGAVGATVPATDRLAHIARLGVLTRGWSYRNRGLEAPEVDVSVTLTAPSGETWTYGEPSVETVSGSALEFCEVVTQRKHLDDTELVATPTAREWLLIAQAFAGAPTTGPPPNS